MSGEITIKSGQFNYPVKIKITRMNIFLNFNSQESVFSLG